MEASTTQTTETASTTGTASQSSDAATAAWYSSFTDEAIRTDPSVQLFKTPEDMAKGYVSLQKRFGTDPKLRVDLPADPNDAEAMRAVYAKIGMPESPDKYGLALDDKATDADKTMLTEFTAEAHKLGLPAGMAKGVMGFWMSKVAAAQEAETARMAAAAETGTADLKKAWGGAYDARLKEIGGMLTTYGSPGLQKALEGGNLGLYSDFALMMAKMADRMAEPGGAGGQTGEAAGAQRAMSPDQAKAAVKTLEGDPVKGKALLDASHPQHAAVVKERRDLLRQAEARAT